MSNALEIKIEGLDDLVQSFKKAPALVKAEGERAIKKAILTLVRYSILNFQYFPIKDLKNPNSPRTGFLMGVGRGLVDSYGTLMGKLENVAPYASYVHDGTSKMQPARPFFALAIEQGSAEVQEFFDDALKNIVTKL